MASAQTTPPKEHGAAEPLSRIALAGAAGTLGMIILDKLVSSGKFNVRILRRNDSKSTFVRETDIVDVDFDSVQSLATVVGDQDAVVSVLGSSAISAQKLLTDASIDAGVKRFVPSEFGANIDDPKTRMIPWNVDKVKIQVLFFF